MAFTSVTLNETVEPSKEPLVAIVIDTADYKESLGYPKNTRLVCNTAQPAFQKDRISIVRRKGHDEFEVLRVDGKSRAFIDFHDPRTRNNFKVSFRDILCAYVVSHVVMP